MPESLYPGRNSWECTAAIMRMKMEATMASRRLSCATHFPDVRRVADDRELPATRSGYAKIISVWTT